MKGQVSNEIVFIFAFAVMMILIALLIFPDIGWFGSGIVIHERCMAGGGFNCLGTSVEYTDDGLNVDVLLENAKGFDVENVSIQSTECNSTFTTGIINKTGRFWMNLSGCFPDRLPHDSFDLSFGIRYNSLPQRVTHWEAGSIVAIVPGDAP